MWCLRVWWVSAGSRKRRARHLLQECNPHPLAALQHGQPDGCVMPDKYADTMTPPLDLADMGGSITKLIECVVRANLRPRKNCCACSGFGGGQ